MEGSRTRPFCIELNEFWDCRRKLKINYKKWMTASNMPFQLRHCYPYTKCNSLFSDYMMFMNDWISVPAHLEKIEVWLNQTHCSPIMRMALRPTFWPRRNTVTTTFRWAANSIQVVVDPVPAGVPAVFKSVRLGFKEGSIWGLSIGESTWWRRKCSAWYLKYLSFLLD